MVNIDTLTQVETLCQFVTMNDLLPELELDQVMPSAPFHERHTRVVAAPIEDVWPHCLGVTAREIRTLGPLMTCLLYTSDAADD